MAARYFLDSSFLVARYNRADLHHPKVLEWLETAAARQPSRALTTDYVFDETIAAILSRTRRHSIAANAGLAIRSSRTCEMLVVNREIIDRAWAMFLRHGDKLWSFTDCTSFVVMRLYGISEALTFDPNFREAGFATIP